MNNIKLQKKFALNFDIASITGDSDKLLQGQITTDMNALAQNQLTFTSFCDAKGRIVVSGWILRLSATQVWLVLAAGGFKLLTNLLTKFLPFYKGVEIENLTGAYSLFAAKNKILNLKTFTAIAENLKNKQNYFFIKDSNLFMKTQLLNEHILMLGANNNYVPNEQGLDFFLEQKEWDYHQAYSGFVLVNKHLTSRFIPQMLNYQHFDAISLNKGCFTGQEVIARLEFRGKIKTCISLFEASKINKLDEFFIGKKIIFAEKPVGEVIFTAKFADNFLFLCYIREEFLNKRPLTLEGNKLIKNNLFKMVEKK